MTHAGANGATRADPSIVADLHPFTNDGPFFHNDAST